MEKKYPRNLIGYGSKQIKVVWPNNAFFIRMKLVFHHFNCFF